MEGHTGHDSPAHGSFAAPDCPTLNALLPAFLFHELIGCGDRGAVYRAQQISLSRDVAIKVLPPELSAIESFARSFKVEARAMAKLIHPNLIGIYDFGEVAGMLYLVMEFIDGNVLHRSTKGRKVEPVQAAEIVEGVARGLGEAHQHALLHRDIKPASILVTRKLKPVLGDFGLAGRADDMGPGMKTGTPGYVAPEVLHDSASASPASDVYSLGIILHELVTGVAPSLETPADLSLVPDLRGLPELVGRTLAPDPLERPADGKAFAHELETWLEAARQTRAPLLTPVTPGRPSSSILKAPAIPSSRSHQGLSPLLLALVGLIIVAAVVFALTGGKERTDLTHNEAGNPGASGSSRNLAPPAPVPDVSTPHPSFHLRAHKSEMRNSLISAANDLVVARQRNVVGFQQEVVGKEQAWQPYLSLIDHGLGLLPRYLSPETKIALDATMVDLLNRYAFDHQRQLEYQHANKVKQLHQESVDTLRRENALPGNRLFESEIHWIEWLGASPFKLLARPPDGEWVLRFGPADARAVHLFFEGGSTVRLLDGEEQAKGTFSTTEDGELHIVRPGDSGSLTLRWREPWLEGRNQKGQKVRFRRRNFTFEVKGQSNPRNTAHPAPQDSPRRPAPTEPVPRDPQLARLQQQYRKTLQTRLATWFSSYDKRIGQLLEQAGKGSDNPTVKHLGEERNRIAALEWERGYLAPHAIISNSFVPPELRSPKTQLQAQVVSTLIEMQETYRTFLLKLQRSRLNANANTDEIDRELVPFLTLRKIDLEDVYNAQPDSRTWIGSTASQIAPAFTGYRSLRGMKYDIGGILQLNSGIYPESNSRLRGKDMNAYYGRKWPLAVNDIPVYQKAGALYLVGGLIWSYWEETGTKVAQVTLNYLDGSSSKPFPLLYRHHIADWYSSRDIPGADRIWRGKRRDSGNQPAIYEIEIPNPQPKKAIKSIGIESGHRAAGPFVLGITLGETFLTGEGTRATTPGTPGESPMQRADRKLEERIEREKAERDRRQREEARRRREGLGK